MERHSPEAMLRIAGYVMGGVLILVLSISLEIAAELTPKEIWQSLGAATAILILAMIRGGARKEAKDRLWITALGHWLIAKLARLITRVHAAEEREAKRASLGQPLHPFEHGADADMAPLRSGAEHDLTSMPAAPAAGSALLDESRDAVGRDVESEPAVTERHGSWVRTEANPLWLPDAHVPTRPARKREPRHDE